MIQGGSTLTQQLVKNYFLSDEQTLGRKLTEAVMALLLEAHFSKEEILVAYLNEVYLGQDGERAIHGFGLGSEYFFAKPLDELDVGELALLIGLVKGPSYYDPREHPDRARARRNLVLQQLAGAHLIDSCCREERRRGSARTAVAGQPLRARLSRSGSPGPEEGLRRGRFGRGGACCVYLTGSARSGSGGALVAAAPESPRCGTSDARRAARGRGDRR